MSLACGVEDDDESSSTASSATTAEGPEGGEASQEGGEADSESEASTGDEGPPPPCASGSNNHVTPSGECTCDTGFQWCSSDVTDLNCCEIGSETGDGACGPPEALCQDNSECCSGTCETSRVGFGNCL